MDQLRGALIVSKIDLTSIYHQIRTKQKFIPKTASKYRDAHHEYLAKKLRNVIAFGIISKLQIEVKKLRNLIYKALWKSEMVKMKIE